MSQFARQPGFAVGEYKSALPDGFTTGPQSIFSTFDQGTGYRNSYMLVRFIDAVTYTINHSVAFANWTLTEVTNDRSGGSAEAGVPFAGVVPNTDEHGNAVTAIPAENDYGWIKIEGYHSALLADGSVAEGEVVTLHATTDGALDTESGTFANPHALRRVGVATAADGGSPVTTAVFIQASPLLSAQID